MSVTYLDTQVPTAPLPLPPTPEGLGSSDPGWCPLLRGDSPGFQWFRATEIAAWSSPGGARFIPCLAFAGENEDLDKDLVKIWYCI